MNKHYFKAAFILLFISTSPLLFGQAIGINNSATAPDPSTILDLNTGNNFTSPNGKGLLIPNVMLTSASDAITIASPAYSLLVYVPNGSGLTPAGYYYNSNTVVGSATWVMLATGGAVSYVKDSAWLLTGNSGTSPSINWLGTNDGEALQFKVNGQKSGWIDYTVNNNTFFGYESGNVITSGSNNTGTGYTSLVSNTTGSLNSATGYDALNQNATGSFNTANGAQSLASNTTGSSNTSIGTWAGYQNIANANTFVGDSAGYNNTSGTYNTFVGYQSNANAGTYTNATAIGYGATANANNSITLGNTNATALYLPGYPSAGSVLYTSAASGLVGSTAVGTAGQVLTSNNSSAPVWKAPSSYVKDSAWLLTGNYGTSPSTNWLGTNDAEALQFKVDGEKSGWIDYLSTTGNSFFGYEAGNITTGGYNTAVGYQALQTNTIGTDNTAVGYQTLIENTGSNNTGVGFGALLSNSSGNLNTSTGYGSLFLNSTGGNNTTTGALSLYTNSTGNNNTAQGYACLYFNTGNNNTAEGYYALAFTSSGINNTGVGYQAGQTNTIGTLNTFLGYDADTHVNNLTNATSIGNGAIVYASNNMMFGNTAVIGWGFGATPSGTQALIVGTNATNGNGANLTITGNWTSTSDSTKKHDIQNITYGLAEVMKLRPVSYEWKGTNQKDIGFLAQEVRHILPEIVYGEEGHMTLSYGQFAPVLTKAIQQQQAMIDSLKIANENLKVTACKLQSDNAAIIEEVKNLKANMQNSQVKNEAEIAALKKLVDSVLSGQQGGTQAQASAK